MVQTWIQYLQSQLQDAGEAEDPSEDEPLPHYQQMTMDHFLGDMTAADEESQPVGMTVASAWIDLQPRRRRTASSSTLMPHQTLDAAAGHGVSATVHHFRRCITQRMMQGEVEDYHNAIRAVTKEVTRQVDIRASRLRILLLLLADLTAQPKQDGEERQQALTQGFDAFYDILNQVDGLELE